MHGAPAEHNKTFTWNIVTRNPRGHELLREKLHQKIRELERYLQRFPADAVHLLIESEKHPRKMQHRAVLTLRQPSHILHSNKSAKTVIAALSNAVKALLHEIESLKQRLRQEPERKRRERQNQLTLPSRWRKTQDLKPSPTSGTHFLSSIAAGCSALRGARLFGPMAAIRH